MERRIELFKRVPIYAGILLVYAGFAGNRLYILPDTAFISEIGFVFPIFRECEIGRRVKSFLIDNNYIELISLKNYTYKVTNKGIQFAQEFKNRYSIDVMIPIKNNLIKIINKS